MGVKASKGENPSSWKLFTAEEQAELQRNYNTLREGKELCSPSSLKKQWSPLLEEKLLERLLKHLISTSSDFNKSSIGISFAPYVHIASAMLRGTAEEQANGIWAVAMDTDNIVTTEEMINYVRSITESYLRSESNSPPFNSWKHSQPTASSRERFSIFLLHELIFKGKQTKETLHSEYGQENFTKDDVEKWISKCPLLSTIQIAVFQQLFCVGYPQSSLFPVCRGIPSSPSPSVLDVTNVLFLNAALPVEYRNEWRFIYSTRVHGESFSKLLGCITDQGPTIVVVVEKSNQVFGGFAPLSWTQGPKFIGTSDSFLFNLSPKMAIYPTSGYNSHYMYLNLGQQTLPNGLGMGGQLEYFGLWLDSDFGKGQCSPTCTTFQSPQLATRQEFTFEHLEVWGVGPAPVKDENERVKKSVLDQNLEDQAILSMAGKTSASIKEDRLTEDDK